MRKSKLLTLIAHEVVPRKCVNNIEFVGYVARCSQCGEPIAIYYKLDDELRVSVLPRFKRFAEEIEKKIIIGRYREDAEGHR